MKQLRITPKHPIAKYSMVALDGEDVTGDCFLANERIGVVGLFLKNEQGNRFIQNHGVAREFLGGDVKIKLRDFVPEGVRKYYTNLREGIQ